ncbi:DinB family protein [Nocardioides nematodiphilus]|uniref:DinB family protein n=1 Tax=Nocardioides nematodiphilus TaxID=2849669 RepID=UPI001CD9AF01|nr:DinB family protein [Nocardioides nematodiphilus]MCA1982335.1 DinB family protein [Nocardioides nematodiphilus]
MPAHAPAAPDERSALAGYLRQQQDAFRNAAFGLTDQQAGLRTTASALTVGSLIKHVTLVSRSWLDVALAAPERPAFGPSAEGATEAWLAAWTWTESDSLAEALRAFDEVSASILAAVAQADLDTPAPVPDAPWFPKDVASWSVRWVWFHVIEEIARHAGHADIVREALDGATSIELLAGREGWPEMPFVKPWRPAAA